MRSCGVVFSVLFFRFASVHFPTEPFCVRSLARSFLWAFSQGSLPCILSHGRFQSTFSQGRSQCALSSETFWCTFFSGASSVHFLSGKSSMGSIAVAFSVGCLTGPFHFALSFKGEFHKLLRGDYFPTPFRSAFFPAFLR